jgi:hypothetical protein
LIKVFSVPLNFDKERIKFYLLILFQIKVIMSLKIRLVAFIFATLVAGNVCQEFEYCTSPLDIHTIWPVWDDPTVFVKCHVMVGTYTVYPCWEGLWFNFFKQVSSFSTKKKCVISFMK